METMWLDPAIAAQISACLLATAAVLRWRNRPALRPATALANEAAIVLALYALWQFVHERAVTKVAGANEHAVEVWHLEQRLHIANELGVERLFLRHRTVMQFLNLYYAGVHVPAVGIVLVWLFFRHRTQYSPVRNALALLTAGCLLIQTIPVSPPRLMPQLGFADVAVLLHQSVYGTGGSGVSNQLAAMPSLHVGWALLVGWAVITLSTSRYRWWVVLHPALTILAVTATANHWWLDGVVAGLILAGILLLQHFVALAYRRVATRLVPGRRLLGGGLLQDVYTAGRPEADDVRQPDLGAFDLAGSGLPTKVMAHLPDVGDTGGGDRMTF
jgi:PAP2 superfamily